MKHSKLTTVAHVHGSGCAGLMIALLRGAGIPAFIDDFYTGHVFSDASYAFGGMRIQVPNHHATEAQALIGSVSPFSSTPMRWLRAIILMTMFLTFGGGITAWAMFPMGAVVQSRMRVLPR